MDSANIDWIEAPAPVASLLRHHPRIEKVIVADSPIVRFTTRGWKRELHIGNSQCYVRGVPELIDNNPIVCCDEFSLPSPFAHALSLVAGPMSLSGIPTLVQAVASNLSSNNESDKAFLEDIYLDTTRTLLTDRAGTESDILEAVLRIPEDIHLEEIIAIFRQRYDGAFLISGESLPFPGATFSLAKWNLDEGTFTVRIDSPVNGKFGAAGQVHALNVMMGYDEGLGLLSI